MSNSCPPFRGEAGVLGWKGSELGELDLRDGAAPCCPLSLAELRGEWRWLWHSGLGFPQGVCSFSRLWGCQLLTLHLWAGWAPLERGAASRARPSLPALAEQKTDLGDPQSLPELVPPALAEETESGTLLQALLTPGLSRPLWPVTLPPCLLAHGR